MSYSEGISEQIFCPHQFRAGGIEGCTAGRKYDCLNCNHPDKRVDKVKWSSASTD